MIIPSFVNDICIVTPPIMFPSPPIQFSSFFYDGLIGILLLNSLSYALYWNWIIADLRFAPVSTVIHFKSIVPSSFNLFCININASSMSPPYVLPWMNALLDKDISSKEAYSLVIIAISSPYSFSCNYISLPSSSTSSSNIFIFTTAARSSIVKRTLGWFYFSLSIAAVASFLLSFSFSLWSFPRTYQPLTLFIYSDYSLLSLGGLLDPQLFLLLCHGLLVSLLSSPPYDFPR